MSFCDDREDMYSIALTTVASLLRKYGIDPRSIGRLEVGTETLLDKSKSCKSVLMQLFEPSGNTNVEGVDTINACYGGTNALFNAVNWVESSAWDGRDAIVVAGDIALYKKGNARPTGGAGCVAMLVGPDAPLVLEPGLRGSYIRHVYDFYKADFTSEYAIVDGQYSLKCYTEAVDACYRAYLQRKADLAKLADGQANGHTNGHTNGHANGHTNGAEPEPETAANAESTATTPLDAFDFAVFHAPTCKVVVKSYARLLYNDYLADPRHPAFADVPPAVRDVPYDASLTDKSVEKAFLALSKKRFAERVQPGTQVPTLCGNMYCGSVYGSLISLLCFVGAERLRGKRVGVFSYGSGLASSMFSIRVSGDVSGIVEKVDLQNRLEARRTVAPEVYDEVSHRGQGGGKVLLTERQMCNLREEAHLKKGYKPKGDVDTLLPDTYYLTEVDDMFRRKYEVKA